jgi:Transcriptional regulator
MIKKACIELLKKGPASKITIHELCEEAGVNRSTFYRYYTDIFDLCDKIEDDCYNALTAEVGAFEITQTNVFLCNILSTIKENPVFNMSLMRNINSSKMVGRIIDYYRTVVIGFWKKEHPDIPDTELEYTFAALIGSISQVITTWVQGGMKESYYEICAVMNRLSFLGLFQ